MAARLRNGSYRILPEAEPEAWADVKDDAVSIEHLGAVTGCGSFNHAVLVRGEGNTRQIYLTDGDKFEDE